MPRLLSPPRHSGSLSASISSSSGGSSPRDLDVDFTALALAPRSQPQPAATSAEEERKPWYAYALPPQISVEDVEERKQKEAAEEAAEEELPFKREKDSGSFRRRLPRVHSLLRYSSKRRQKSFGQSPQTSVDSGESSFEELNQQQLHNLARRMSGRRRRLPSFRVRKEDVIARINTLHASLVTYEPLACVLYLDVSKGRLI